MSDFSFFLGGRDLEMATIADLVRSVPEVELHNFGRVRGGDSGSYEAEARAALARGRRALLV